MHARGQAMAFGKRGLKEYEARQQAASARNGSLPDAVQSLAAIMDRLIQAGDGAIGYLCERADLKDALAQFEPADLTAAMTYAGTTVDLFPVLGHVEPPEATDFSEHLMLHSLACNIVAGRKFVTDTDGRRLPDRPGTEDLEPFGEAVFATIVLQAIVLKHYLAALALHISTDSPKRVANAEPGIEAELEARCRKGQTDLTSAVRRWSSRNMAHHDQAETILMQAKIPMFPFAAGNSAAAGSAVRNGVWVPDDLAGKIAEPA